MKIDGSAFSVDNASTFSNRMLLMNYDLASKKPSIILIDCVDTRVQSYSVTFNFQKIQWVHVAYRTVLSFPAFVDQSNGKKSFQDQFLASSCYIFQTLNNSIATFNGKFRDDYEILTAKNISSSKKSSTNNAQEIYDVDLFMDDSYDSVDSDDVLLRPCVVKMFVKGSIVGRVCLPNKATVGEAIKCIKTDILRSVYARIELHSEGMLVVEGEELEPIALHQLPRRVFAPLTSSLVDSSPLMVCDYLFEGDGGDDSVQSLKEVLDIDVELESIEDGFESVVDEQNLSSLNLSFSPIKGGTSATSSRDDDNDFADRINKIETEKQARLSMWPLYLTLLSFIVGLLSYLIYVWVAGNE